MPHHRHWRAAVDFHDLRHTAVAHWIDAGVPLGHSSEAFTARVYRRLLPATHERSARLVEEAMLRAVAKGEAISGEASG